MSSRTRCSMNAENRLRKAQAAGSEIDRSFWLDLAQVWLQLEQGLRTKSSTIAPLKRSLVKALIGRARERSAATGINISHVAYIYSESAHGCKAVPSARA